MIRKDLSSKIVRDLSPTTLNWNIVQKSVPDGKRCRMKKPNHKNVLFVGEWQGQGDLRWSPH